MLTSLCFVDKQTEDRPESPPASSKVDLSLQEMPRQEVEKSIERSTAVAQGILGCHSVLVVSNFLYLSTCMLSSTLSLLCLGDRIWLSKSLSRPSSFGRLERVFSCLLTRRSGWRR